ncbi:MAG: hypothetical protein MMC33_009088 [Icmadophila ericetorum]|nr:hypothetical protein [Icmadophila ericetorum]
MLRVVQCRARRPISSILSHGRFPSFNPNISCRRAFSNGSTYWKDDRDNDRVKVSWWDQLIHDSPSRVKAEPGFVEQEDKELEIEIKNRIDRLEQELRELQKGKLLEILSPEDRERVKKALVEDETLKTQLEAVDNPHLGEDGGGESRQKDSGAKGLRIRLHLSPEKKLYLNNLNSSLEEVWVRETDDKARNELWRWYTRCKQNLPPFSSLVPDAAWKVLWESQSKAEITQKQRAMRLRTLSEDMIQGRRMLSPPQKMTFINSLLVEGRFDEALKKWESEEVELRAIEGAAQTFEDLGVRVYAAAGYVQEAQDLALGVLTASDAMRSRILLPVIASWAEKGTEETLRQAWALYVRLKTQLGAEITLKDYDEVTMSFMRVGRTDIALAIFKDMMLSRTPSQYDSTELYRAALGRVDDLHTQSVDLTELTRVSMTALIALPRTFQNKFFYASWMKRLLGMGEVDAAASVVELMYQRGVSPDPKHLNGIIAAWLRTGYSKNVEKGIKLATAMIQQRVFNVASRRGSNPILPGSTSERTDLQTTIQKPSNLLPPKRSVPSATIETFSILLLHYERRSMQTPIQQLQLDLSASEIAPNTYFMNHLLYASLRRGQHRDSWKTYKAMSQTVRPDLETYACLWDCEKAHLDRLLYHPTDNFPGPREIFCEMMTRFSKMNKRERDSVLEEFTRDVYDQIIRCMCLANDVEGTTVALHALHHSFNHYPDQSTVRMILMQVVRMGEEQVPREKARRKGRTRMANSSRNRLNLGKLAQVLELIGQTRAKELRENGFDADNLDEKSQAAEQLHILTQFLRNVLERTSEADEKGREESIEKAAWEMGVSGIKMEDPLHQMSG